MGTYTLSKSKYVLGVQCPKILWMDINMPEKAVDTASESVLETGTEVGILARQYYDGCVTVAFDYSKKKMCADTGKLMEDGVRIIAEASFMYNNNFCSVDILKISDDGVSIIEVKSSTEVHDIYYHDMAYQYYVLKHCGINVTSVINMHINKEYVRYGELQLDKLFIQEDCTDIILEMQQDIESGIDDIYQCISESAEPCKEPGLYCEKPYECRYKEYCHRDICEPSIFDIHRLAAKTKYQLYSQGIVSYEDIIREQPKLSDKQWRQVTAFYNDEPPSIDKPAIREFLNTLSYPLYYLDFETYQQAIPQFDGVKPYMQIPFQYSLHVQSEINGPLKHYEFLGKEGTDPRRALAESLCSRIPVNVCSLAYNMSFEKTVIKNLAGLFDDLSGHLMNIHDNMRDLMVPFQKQSYYCKEFQGSYSIKWVLPAMCKGDPELDYHGLDEVHNGSEAMAAFAGLAEHSPDEIQRIRKNLLAYCRLDTLAMVKILEKLFLSSKQ